MEIRGFYAAKCSTDRNYKAPKKENKLTDGGGFHLLVKPNGAKTLTVSFFIHNISASYSQLADMFYGLTKPKTRLCHYYLTSKTVRSKKPSRLSLLVSTTPLIIDQVRILRCWLS